MKFERLEKHYVRSVAVVLIITALAKLISAGQEVAFLAKADPIFSFFTNRQILFFAAILEFMVAILLFFHSRNFLKLCAIAWLATFFLLYHIGIWLTGYRGPCKCLGGSLDWLTKNESIVRNAPKFLLAYFLCSYLFIIVNRTVQMKLSTLAKSLIVLAFLSLVCLGQAQVFQATGEVEYWAYNANGSSYQNYHYDFTLSVSNNQWYIKTIWPDSFIAEHGCDGESVFGVIYDYSSGTNRVPPGDINSGTYPLLTDPYNRVLWLAFASSPYLDRMADSSMPAPWAGPLVDPYAYAYKTQLERSKVPPRLPMHLKFVADRDLISSAPKNTNLNNPSKDEIAALSSIPVGFLGGEYFAKTTTNFNGLEIPTEFEMIQYYVPIGLPAAKWSGHVSAITLASMESYLPEINRPVSIADYRFRNDEHSVRFINYNLTNRNWPTEKDLNDPDLRQRFLAKINQQVSEPKEYVPRTPIAVILAVVFFVPPLAILFGKIWLAKTNKTKK